LPDPAAGQSGQIHQKFHICSSSSVSTQKSRAGSSR